MTLLAPADWGAFRVEGILLAGLLLLLIVEIVRPRGSRSPAGWLLIAAAAAALWSGLATAVPDAALWNGAFTVDALARYFKVLFLVCVIIVALSSLTELRDQPWAGEFYLCLGGSALGMMLLAGAGELISLFVSLELVSVSLFVMAGLRRGDVRSQEAGLKYLLIGAISTALFLFGASLVYMVCGSTLLKDIAASLPLHLKDPLLLIGLVLILAAMGFKTAAVPFHMWAPDVYEGGPTPMVAFASVASKATGFVLMIRLLLGPFRAMADDWVPLVSLMAAATLVVGSFLALPQTNIKRMLAYSSIAQAGYLLLGILAGTQRGVSAVLLYLGVYVFTNLGAFLTVVVVTRDTGSEEIADYTGLARRSPLLALSMMISLLSLAGIPPLGGFAGKLFLFASAMEQPGRFLWLVVLAVLLSIVSLYYYLMVIKQMYIGEPKSPAPVPLGAAAGVALLLCTLGVLATGIFPGVILEFASGVARTLL